MAVNAVEYLKEGKIDFIFGLTLYDVRSVIKWVREREDRMEVIHGFLSLLKGEFPWFCFEIIYDIEEYKDTTIDLISHYKNCSLNAEKTKNILEHTTWGRDYILNHLDEIIVSEDNNEVILEFIFSNFEKNLDFVKKFSLHKNLHIRFLFMKKLVEERYDKVGEVYDDILQYLTSYTDQEFEQMTLCPTLMDSEDISSLAMSILLKAQDKKMWTRLKEYILKNYKENDLGEMLLERDKQNSEFSKDATPFFETSRNYQFYIFRNYSHLISKAVISEYKNKIKYFIKDGDYDSTLASIYGYALGRKLEKYTEEYLEKSKDKTVKYLLSGSTSSCYQIGNYVIKLFHSKWSYEEVLCPRLYLLLRNLEEEYVRNELGHIVAGIEVQNYLDKPAAVPYSIFELWRKDLKRLGYYFTDTLVNGNCGDNCRLLNSYRDADCYNPEILPDWFKEYPLVLVDRDRVYQLENEYPKQIRERY